MSSSSRGQIAIVGKDIDDYRRLAAFLKDEGCTLTGRLAELNDDDKIIAVIVDTDRMEAHETSTMIMACRASCGLPALTAREYIDSKEE